MINRITGQLVAINETHASIRIGGLDYEVLLPDVVRRQLQSKLNSEVSLRAIEYLEGNPQQGRMVPRIVGFMNDAELEFFELFCSVDGVGVKKALRAMVRPVREIAVSIEEQDAKGLSALPGIGPAMAERIIAKLRRRMTRFALMIASR
ncbi:MAG: Holliday junction branch migration protein RuvA, partial [Planctomyces sp.]